MSLRVDLAVNSARSQPDDPAVRSPRWPPFSCARLFTLNVCEVISWCFSGNCERVKGILIFGEFALDRSDQRLGLAVRLVRLTPGFRVLSLLISA